MIVIHGVVGPNGGPGGGELAAAMEGELIYQLEQRYGRECMNKCADGRGLPKQAPCAYIYVCLCLLKK